MSYILTRVHLKSKINVFVKKKKKILHTAISKIVLKWYENKVRHGWRFDPGFTAKSVKKVFRGENEHWEFLDISFLG